MGRRYYCEYCDKSMVSAPSIIRTHNNGILHQKLVRDHYQKFKDPETILAEESNKKPCNRFVNGQCQFGAVCWYSHYTVQQINYLREIVAAKNAKPIFTIPSFQELYENLQSAKKAASESNSESCTTILYDNESGLTHILPWVYNDVLESYGDNLPPSVKKMEIQDFRKAEPTTWG